MAKFVISKGLNAPKSQCFPGAAPLAHHGLTAPQTPQLVNSAAAAASNAASRQ